MQFDSSTNIGPRVSQFGWFNCFGKHNCSVWNLVPHCLMWTVWRERNSRIFDDVDLSITKLEELFFGCLFYWARVWGLTKVISLAAFAVSLNFSKSFSQLSCNYLSSLVHSLCTQREFLFSNKSFVTYQKKKKIIFENFLFYKFKFTHAHIF